MRHRATLSALATAGLWCGVFAAAPVQAQVRVQVREPAALARAPAEMRVGPTRAPAGSTLKIDDPRSMLRTSYGQSLVDLFPFQGGKFHLSAGGKLFSRPGRPRALSPESLMLLPAFRAGAMRATRRFSPVMLIGYGHSVERGLALGFDAGMVMGPIVQTPDRLGVLNRARANAAVWRGTSRGTINQLARMTALYRF